MPSNFRVKDADSVSHAGENKWQEKLFRRQRKTRMCQTSHLRAQPEAQEQGFRARLLTGPRKGLSPTHIFDVLWTKALPCQITWQELTLSIARLHTSHSADSMSLRRQCPRPPRGSQDTNSTWPCVCVSLVLNTCSPEEANWTQEIHDHNRLKPLWLCLKSETVTATHLTVTSERWILTDPHWKVVQISSNVTATAEQFWA